MTVTLRIAVLLAAVWLAGCVHLPDTAHPANATAPTDGPITNATPLADVIRRKEVRPLDPDAAMPLLEQAVVELAKTDPRGRYRGITYDLSRDNALDPHWLVQTPDNWGQPAATLAFFPAECAGAACDADFRLPFCRRPSDCPEPGAVCGHLRAFDAEAGLAGKSLCLGHSDAVLDRIYRPIADAHQAVDIAALQPVPDLRFLAALRNAVTMLARSGRAVTLRVLVGQYPPDGADPRALLADLVRDAKTAPGARLRVYAAAMRSCTGSVSCGSFSWNHAKIVAVDGRTALVGGHNLWTQDYLLDRPVHDLSMQVRGSAAIDAHRFADRLWEYVCDHDDPVNPVSTFVYRSGAADIAKGCLETIRLPAQSAGSGAGIPILASARLASGITDDFANQHDLARDLVFGAARHEIDVAQQDVAFAQAGEAAPLFPELTLDAWADFMLAGRGDLFLVLSNLGAKGRGGGDYSNGVPLEAVARKMLQVARARSPRALPDLIDLVCRHFHLAPYRFGPDATWPGGHPIGNHSKFWMVDDRYFYIGSDNLYPVDLQEFGYIVDDRAAASGLRRSYWEKLWRWSRTAAISGSDAPGCVLRSEARSEHAAK